MHIRLSCVCKEIIISK